MWKSYKIDNLNIECRTDSNYNGSYSTVVFINEVYAGEMKGVSTDNYNFMSRLTNFVKKIKVECNV